MGNWSAVISCWFRQPSKREAVEVRAVLLNGVPVEVETQIQVNFTYR